MYFARLRRLIALTVITVILLSSVGAIHTYAVPAVPDIIKIGLSYGSSAANNFTLRGEGGLSIEQYAASGYVPLISTDLVEGLTIRRDSYYNVVKGKATEINYVRAAEYAGDVIGPYHIQVGDVYPDINMARQVVNLVQAVTPQVYLVYEDGWRVWTQLYLDEDECKQQIQVMQNELGSFSYTVVYPDRKRVQVLDAATSQLLYIINAESNIRFTPIQGQDPNNPIQYNASKYRGKIVIKRLKNSDINVVNELPFEQYLYGVVPVEMPASWNAEALKAQAVAARNYGIYSMGKHKAYEFDLCNTNDCQVYSGYGKEDKRTNAAVDATKGKLLVYDGQIVATFFHSSSGGYTEDIENVWGSSLPYIKAVDDKYSLGSPYDNWANQIDKDKIKDKLAAAKIDIGDVTDIVPLQITEHGRVTNVEIRGTKGSKCFEKEKMRSLLGDSILKSIWYTVETDADIWISNAIGGTAQKQRASGMSVITASGVSKLASSTNKMTVKSGYSTAAYNITPYMYTFKGKGWGHGLGMSQYGAKGMAEAGFDYIQILEHYYTGAKVQ